MPTANAQSPLVADFQVAVNGSPLPVAVALHVVGIEVEDSVELPGMFAVELAASEHIDQISAWIDDQKLFVVGNALEVKLGYVDALASLIKGEITALEPEFVGDRLPRLRLRGYDRRHRLQRGRKVRSFVQQKDSDIAAQIAGDAGLTAQVEDSGVVHDYVLQANESDLDFLQQRARRIEYEVVVDDKTLIYRPVANAAGEILTTFGQIHTPSLGAAIAAHCRPSVEGPLQDARFVMALDALAAAGGLFGVLLSGEVLDLGSLPGYLAASGRFLSGTARLRGLP